MPNAEYAIPIELKGDDTADVLVYQTIGNSLWEEGLTAKAFADNLKALGKGIKTINVRINSSGGNVFDATAIYNTLRNHGAKVVTHIEGAALSAASLIAMAGHERRMAKNGYVMIHDPSGRVAGRSSDMRRAADMLDKVKDTIVGLYAERSNKSREELASMMEKETWLTSNEAKEYGFVDAVTEDVKVVAAFDVSMFSNVPDELRQPQPQEPAMSKPEPQQPVAATVAEIENACPGCDAAFVVAQAKANATIAQAQTAWMAEMSKRLAEANAALAKAAEKTSAPAASGVDPLPAGGNAPPPKASAKEEFDAAVAELVDNKVPKAKAIRRVIMEQPALHQAMLAEVNSK